MTTEPSSRAATNELLAGLHTGRWRRPAWSAFLTRTTRRSIHQAAQRPRALLEITVLHCVFDAVGRRARRGLLPSTWTAASWLMAACHLGLLEQRRSLSLADVLTLVRANLPALAGTRVDPWLPAVALSTDLLDGRLARASGTHSPFGRYADYLADAAFWTWFTLANEPSGRMRAAAVGAWVLPVVAVATISVARGRMVDAPRPRVLRPAVAFQVVLAVRRRSRVSAR
ncbi:MAG: CDP-alcohol phosphatidyltransferase family protein [Pseudonocardiaceae bacterium]